MNHLKNKLRNMRKITHQDSVYLLIRQLPDSRVPVPRRCLPKFFICSRCRFRLRLLWWALEFLQKLIKRLLELCGSSRMSMLSFRGCVVRQFIFNLLQNNKHTRWPCAFANEVDQRLVCSRGQKPRRNTHIVNVVGGQVIYTRDKIK